MIDIKKAKQKLAENAHNNTIRDMILNAEVKTISVGEEAKKSLSDCYWPHRWSKMSNFLYLEQWRLVEFGELIITDKENV